MSGSNLIELVRNDVESGHFQEALGRLKNSPSDASIEYWRGRALFGLGDYEQAVVAYTLAIEKEPDNGEAFAQRAFANRKTRHGYYDAIEDLEMAVSIQPNNLEWREQLADFQMTSLNYEGAMATFADLVTRVDQPKADWHVKRALCIQGLMHEEDEWHQAALDEATKAIAIDPTSIEAWRIRYEELSELHWRNIERYEVDAYNPESFRAAAKLVELAPDDEGFNRSLSHEASLSDDYPVIIETATRYISKVSNVGDRPFEARAGAYRALGEFEKAIADYDVAISKMSDGIEKVIAYDSRAECKLKLGRIDEAIEDTNAALKLGGGGSTLECRARCYIAKQDWKAALADLDAIRARNPQYAASRRFLEVLVPCLEGLGRTTEADTTRRRLQEMPEESE